MREAGAERPLLCQPPDSFDSGGGVRALVPIAYAAIWTEVPDAAKPFEVAFNDSCLALRIERLHKPMNVWQVVPGNRREEMMLEVIILIVEKE